MRQLGEEIRDKSSDNQKKGRKGTDVIKHTWLCDNLEGWDGSRGRGHMYSYN